MKILLAIDDSAVSLAALREVMRRPLPESATVRIITVVGNEYPMPVMGIPDVGISPATIEAYTEAHELRWNEASGMVAAIANQLTAAGIDAEGVVRKGDAADAIIEEARSWSADLVLMGSHGRRGLKRVLMGSVAQKVLARAPCSVEVVREHAEEKHAP